MGMSREATSQARLSSQPGPRHFVGLTGVPRRIADYPDADAGRNLASAIAAYIFALGQVFALNTILAFRRNEAAGVKPWG
jgi:cytochrome c oxidase subunit 1